MEKCRTTSLHGTLHGELQVGFYGNKTSPFPACKGRWHGTAYSHPANFSVFLPGKGTFVHTTYCDQSLVYAVPCVVPKLLVFRQIPPALLAFTHFQHVLAKKQASPVLYLGLKALYIYWNST